MKRLKRARRGVVMAAALLLLLPSAACTVRHLHPDVGEAVNRIFRRQARRRPGPPIPATGEEAEVVLKNYQRASTKSSTKSTPAGGLRLGQ